MSLDVTPLFSIVKAMDPRISTVICTHNRSGLLAQALESLCHQSLPKDDYEVLVIDNASTDDTEAVTRSFRDGRAHVTYLQEPVLGLSRARNLGLQEARGRYVAFLDDDAIAESGWLEEILAAFAEVEPAPGCVGGKILPNWQLPRPFWLHDVLMRSLSVIDWADEAFFVEPPYFLVGTNIAYDRSLVLKIGGFDENLGRIGKALLSNDEIELISRVKATGRLAYYTPKAVVSHLISRARLTKAWHFNRAKWQGISDGLVHRRGGWRAGPANLGEVAKELFNPKIVRFIGRALVSPNPQDRFLFQTLIWAKLNYARTLLTGGPRLTRG